MAENKNMNSQEIRELLIKKEGLIAVLPRGRMVVKRPRKIKNEQEKVNDALERVNKKLGAEKAASFKAEWDALSTGRGGKDRLIRDG